MKILVINPGGMSTKIAVYDDETSVFSETIEHSKEELSSFTDIASQKAFRKQAILLTLKKHGLSLQDISQFVGRGGMVRNLPGGVYRINESYLRDAKAGLNGQHASNLGGIIAHEFAKEVSPDLTAFTVDPVVVDEYDDIARISGLAGISRVRSFHALNHKAVAKRFCREQGINYQDARLIVAHLGSGISVGVHKEGRVVDVNSALGGDGPMSPERAGGVPPLALLEMCFSGMYSYQELSRKLTGEGGVYGYLGTSDLREVEARIKGGDNHAQLILEAMAYQIAKEIGACAAVLEGAVDGIILTGSIARSRMITGWVEERVRFIQRVTLYPGENEMEALASGLRDGLSGKQAVMNY